MLSDRDWKNVTRHEIPIGFPFYQESPEIKVISDALRKGNAVLIWPYALVEGTVKRDYAKNSIAILPSALITDDESYKKALAQGAIYRGRSVRDLGAEEHIMECIGTALGRGIEVYLIPEPIASDGFFTLYIGEMQPTE